MLLGNKGDGSFGAATNFPVGTNPYSVAIRGCQWYSKPDLAIPNYSSNNISILLGNGDGSFGTATNFPVGTNPESVAIADVNGDSKLDLAVTNSGSSNVSGLVE